MNETHRPLLNAGVSGKLSADDAVEVYCRRYQRRQPIAEERTALRSKSLLAIPGLKKLEGDGGSDPDRARLGPAGDLRRRVRGRGVVLPNVPNLFMAGRNISVTHVGLLLVHDYAVIIAWTFLQIVCSQPGTLSTSHSLPRMNGWFVAFIAASNSRDMACTCSTVITSSE